MCGCPSFANQAQPQLADGYITLSPAESTSELDRVGSSLDTGFPTYQLQLRESEATPFSSFTSASSIEPASSDVSGWEVELGSFAAAREAQVLQGRLQCENCYSTFSDTTALK